MFSRLAHLVIWKCADDVPAEKLYRHHRIAARICMIGFGAAVLMASSGAEFVATPKEWLRMVSITVLLVSTGIALLTFVPAIISVAWASDVEKELKARGLPLPKGAPVGEWAPWFAMKMCFWFAVMVFIGWMAQR